MKTRKQWFLKMPKDIRNKAIANTLQDELDITEVSFKNALERSFVFSESPEGSAFWNGIVNRYNK
jgi:hypothetical protein